MAAGIMSFMLASLSLAIETTGDAKVPEKTPTNVIFDTDICTDIDDMMALAMLHALQDRGEDKLIAVTISTDHKWCASYVDLIDTFYRHPQVPIGIVHHGSDPATYPALFPGVPFPSAYYVQILSERRNSEGAFVYPHRLVDGSQAQDAVALLRHVLASQPDASVVIVQVGFSTNLARLLDSQADAVSPLSGRDLIERKVRLLSVMAGSYGDAKFDGQSRPKGSPEWNLMMDVPAAQEVFSKWPTPVVASGFEVGASILYPASAIDRYFSYVRDHPIAESYRCYVSSTKRHWPHDHATFDLTSVLYAVRPGEDYFSLSAPGRITVLPGGSSRFDPDPNGNQRFILPPSPTQRARIVEAMVMLTSQPPVGCPSSIGAAIRSR